MILAGSTTAESIFHSTLDELNNTSPRKSHCKIFTAHIRNYGLHFHKTFEEVKNTLEEAKKEEADVYFLPIGSFLGYGLGSLEANTKIRDGFQNFSKDLLSLSLKYDFLIVADSYLLSENKMIPCLGVYYKGQALQGVAPNELVSLETHTALTPAVFVKEKGLHFAVVNTSHHKLTQILPQLSEDFDFILVSEKANYTLGAHQMKAREINFTASQLNTPVLYAEGHLGGSGVPYLHNAFSVCALPNKEPIIIAETPVDFQKQFLSHTTTLPTKPHNNTAIKTHYHETMAPVFSHTPFGAQSSNSPGVSYENLNKVHPDPFSEYFRFFSKDFLKELFDMQVKSLALRLDNTGINKIVLPVSGGLDSTLAFLVCIKALRVMKLPLENLIAVTMPGLGTTGTSYKNALELINRAKTDFREINIKESVLLHFKDIGHDPKITDTTFENAQARERTQIALDLANKYGALFVGTGDLSEDALGFCTFGGDHLSNFNVNVCLTKTMVRQMVSFLSTTEEFTHLKVVLQAILDAPVSPELLPSQGEITDQKTEEILGDYILHDFILFYYIKYNMHFSDIYLYLKKAFCDTYKEEQLKHAIITFAKRFFVSQFKRSCQPDATDLTGINLFPTAFHFASDLKVSDFVALLEKELRTL